MNCRVHAGKRKIKKNTWQWFESVRCQGKQTEDRTWLCSLTNSFVHHMHTAAAVAETDVFLSFVLSFFLFNMYISILACRKRLSTLNWRCPVSSSNRSNSSSSSITFPSSRVRYCQSEAMMLWFTLRSTTTCDWSSARSIRPLRHGCPTSYRATTAAAASPMVSSEKLLYFKFLTF